MNAATEFDVGPLSWVKSEIDLALERADQALHSYTASVVVGKGDLTQIKFCRTHLHQVQGALTIIGLDGVKQFSEALEKLLEGVEQLILPAGEATIELAHKSLEAIGHYLDDLVTGQPNQPLRLLPLYQEIQQARGIERVVASDLFYPDLAVRPPRRESPIKKISHEALRLLLRHERARFQRGFLSWLRNPQDRSGVSEMLGAVERIEATQDAAVARSFWWVATGFLSALAEGALPVGVDVKQLCARIDLQIRRLSEGSKNVAERLMRDALYFVANAESSNSAVQRVKATYQLPDVIPAAEAAAAAPKETVRRKLRDIIAAAEEAWTKYCAGSAQSLHVFIEHANALSAIVEQLNQTDYRRLAQVIVAAAKWLSEDSARYSESLAMEVATAVLLSQNAQENFQELGGDFAHQVDVTVARIHGCIAGKPPLPGSEVALLDEMSRKAQEKLLVGQVAREIQTNLAQIEQVLDGFFRDVGKRAELENLDSALHQIEGALTMMHHDDAVAALHDCSAQIRRFARPDYEPVETDFEHVASQLSVIGFFIDSIPHGTVDFATFVRRMQGGEAPEADQEEDDSDVSVEQEVEQQKLETHALLGALKEQPDDAGLRAELKANLTALRNDADLVADVTLGEQAKAMLSALESGGDSAPQIDQALATFKPQALETLRPSAETIQLAQSSREEIDAELLGIFLEEANEVLATIEESMLLLNEQPHNVDVLTTIRRSFHTLKGSGRMVGLKDVGEAAWAVEKTLNMWLRQELEVTPSIIDLICQAHGVFSNWVRHFEFPSLPAPDPAGVIGLAESLLATTGGGDQAEPRVPLAEPVLTAQPDDSSEAVAEAVAQDASEAAEQDQRPSAEIITLDFGAAPSARTHGHGPEESTAEAMALADSGAAMPVESERSPLTESETDEVASPAVQAETQGTVNISPALFEIFREEAGGHLATLKRELPVLEAEEVAPTPHEMYRAAHTLAGISAAVGILPLNELGHALENALLRRDISAQPGSLEALGVIRQAINELDLMLSAHADSLDLALPAGLIESLDAIYPAQLTVPHVSSDLPEEAQTAEEAPALPEVTKAEQVPAPVLATHLQLLKDEIDEQLLPIFLEEALDLNQGIAAQLRAWRQSPDNMEAVRTLARLLHTLKGSARMAGAMNLGQITHAIEARVEQASRAGNVPTALIDEIDSAFDDVLQIIERLQGGETLGDAEGEVSSETEQPLAAVDSSSPVLIERRAEGERSSALDVDAETGLQRATLRVRADLIDRLVNEAGELAIARTRIEGEMRSLKDSLLDLTENVIRLRRQLRDIEIQAELQMQSRTAQADVQHAGFDPLEFDRFTRFQELTRMMAESVNDVGTVQQNLLKNLDDANAAIIAQARLNREVQQELMAVRMVPFGAIADRLYRIVRQTSKELNKRANLEITGSQVELDRSVLDKMIAPLEHMLRNSIAHGLEDRELRLARGKPDIGEISLALRQEGNEIILSFSDDGAGLDLERIRARAIEAGVLRPDEEADPAQLAEMIFLPGFSTAAEISQVSGRGVGMDIVKTEVSGLGGRIEITSVPGQRTEFRLYIPLTLALTKALLVRAGNRTYAIPSVMIEQVLDLKEQALAKIRNAGEAEWMNQHYPFNYLPHLLGDTQALPEQHRQYWVLLLRSGNRRIAVQVDGLMGNREIVVKNIGPQLARVIGVDGATVLGDGQVVLILNPIALSTRTPATEFVAPIPSAPVLSEEEVALSRLPTIMVVDDSLTVRKITGRLLAREGYQVLAAKDGVEALELLLDVVPDVMLVDIEMPRLDGFDLTRNIRSDPRLKSVPIIMITSRTGDKHRNYAFEIGVNHFLGKPFQEEELLRLVADYVSQQRSA